MENTVITITATPSSGGKFWIQTQPIRNDELRNEVLGTIKAAFNGENGFSTYIDIVQPIPGLKDDDDTWEFEVRRRADPTNPELEVLFTFQRINKGDAAELFGVILSGLFPPPAYAVFKRSN